MLPGSRSLGRAGLGQRCGRRRVPRRTSVPAAPATLALLLLLPLLSVICPRTAAVHDQDGCKIFILETADPEVAKHFVPEPRVCKVDNITAVHGASWIKALEQLGSELALPSTHGPFAAGYYLASNIRRSTLRTTSMEEADVILVDTFCLDHHHQLALASGPRSTIDVRVELYAWIESNLKSGKWRIPPDRFAFHYPHPYSYKFIHGIDDEAHKLEKYICGGPLAQSMKLVPERSLVDVCPGDSERWSLNPSFLTVPYTSLINPPWLLLPKLYGAFFSASCGGSLGRDIRSKLVEAYRESGIPNLYGVEDSAGDTTVDINSGNATACSSDALQGPLEELPVVVGCPGGMTNFLANYGAIMARSVFCPIIVGDTQSSRRLTEAVLSGCVPVFVGPPFHSMPLAPYIDYLSIAVFVWLNNNEEWLPGGMRANVTAEAHPFDACCNNYVYWLPEVKLDDIYRVAHKLPAMAGVPKLLHSMPEAEVVRLQRNLQVARSSFQSSESPVLAAESPTMTDRITQYMCETSKAHAAHRHAGDNL